MPHPAYTKRSGHQQRRAALIAQLERVGAALCPICGGIIVPGMFVDLHHTNPADKRAGLPGNVLAHRRCNRGLGDGKKAGRKTTRKDKKARQSREW